MPVGPRSNRNEVKTITVMSINRPQVPAVDMDK